MFNSFFEYFLSGDRSPIAYILVFTITDFIPFLLLYLTGAVGNIRLRKTSELVPNDVRIGILFFFFGTKRSGIEMPSLICYIFEKIALINFPISEFISFAVFALFSQKIYSCQVAVALAAIQIIIWLTLILRLSDYSTKDEEEIEKIAEESDRINKEFIKKENEEYGLKVKYIPRR